MSQEINLISPEGRKRNAGYLNKEKNAFIVHKNFKEHYFRIYNGIGFNFKLVKSLNESGVSKIWVFLEKDEEVKLLKTTPAIVLENGIQYQNDKDIGDLQLILSLEHFEGDKLEINN